MTRRGSAKDHSDAHDSQMTGGAAIAPKVISDAGTERSESPIAAPNRIPL